MGPAASCAAGPQGISLESGLRLDLLPLRKGEQAEGAYPSGVPMPCMGGLRMSPLAGRSFSREGCAQRGGGSRNESTAEHLRAVCGILRDPRTARGGRGP